MCQGCQVVPIHKAADDIDSPFIWNSARRSAIDFSQGGKIWNVPFYVSHRSYSCTVVHVVSRHSSGHSLSFTRMYTHMGTRILTQPYVDAHIHSSSRPTCVDVNGRQRFSRTISSTTQLTNRLLFLSAHRRVSLVHFPSCAELLKGSFLFRWMYSHQTRLKKLWQLVFNKEKITKILVKFGNMNAAEWR